MAPVKLRRISWVTRCVLAPCVVGVLGSACALHRGLPPTQGIGNFARVFRGAQPDAAGLEHLKRLGVRAIINLRQTNDVWAAEEATARAQGWAYTNVPLSGISRPAKAQIETLLQLMDQLPSPIFIHCEHGCDRTGTLIACYRIRQAGWTAAAAQEEADYFGMSAWVRGMRRFIANYAPATAEP